MFTKSVFSPGSDGSDISVLSEDNVIALLPGVEATAYWYEESADETAASEYQDQIDAENEAAQAAAYEAQERAERRVKNTKMCGRKWHALINPYTGIIKYKPWFCKNYDSCPVCATRRKTKIFGFVYSVLLAEHPLAYEILPSTEASQICRTISKEDYRRIPISDTEVVLFFEPTTLPGRGTPITSKAELHAAIDWEHVASTKFKQNISGNLAYTTTLPQPTINEEPVEVELTNWQIITQVAETTVSAHGEGYDMPISLYDVYNDAMTITNTLKPQNPAELNAALQQRANAYKDAAEKRKIACTLKPVTKRVKLYLSMIAWNTEKDLVYQDALLANYEFQAEQQRTWHLKHPQKSV